MCVPRHLCITLLYAFTSIVVIYFTLSSWKGRVHEQINYIFQPQGCFTIRPTFHGDRGHLFLDNSADVASTESKNYVLALISDNF